MDQGPPRLDSQLPAAAQSSSAAPPVLGPPFSSHPEASPPQPPPQLLTEAALQALPMNTANLPPAAHLDGPVAAPAPTEAQDQTKALSPERVHPAPVSAPHSPPGSSAVWKKNQGENSPGAVSRGSRPGPVSINCDGMETQRINVLCHRVPSLL